MLLREGHFERSAELFFEAAAAPDLWPRALTALTHSFGAFGVNLLAVHANGGASVSSPSIQGVMEEWARSEELRTNIYMRRGLELTALGWKGLITNNDMVTPEQAAKDPFVNGWRRKVGFGAEAGMLLVNSYPRYLLAITIDRAAGVDSFTRSEIARMNRLMAVLRPAALLAFEVGLSGERKVADTLATIEKDTALLGSNGRVLYMSRGFERHLGDAFALKSGKLTSWDERTSRILAASIDRAIGRGDVSERVSPRFSIPRRNGRPLLANVIPAVGAAHDILALTRAFLVVADAERLNDEPAAMVSAALRLSPAEGRLAVKIAQGESLKSIAESEQVTLETARKRLKAIFAKTGTHRQTELAILIGKLTSVG